MIVFSLYPDYKYSCSFRDNKMAIRRNYRERKTAGVEKCVYFSNRRKVKLFSLHLKELLCTVGSLPG